MVYNIDDPEAPEFVEYQRGSANDISPEGMVFIPADQSPNGEAPLVVSHEVSGTVALFEIQVVAP